MDFGADTWWLVGILTTVAIGIIGYFLKRTITKQDETVKDVNHIKLTYVTKDELKEVKINLVTDIKKTQTDVEDIKERMLTKQDYYRLQTQTEQKIDKIYDLLIKEKSKNEQ